MKPHTRKTKQENKDLDLDKEVLFFGITTAGAAALLGLKRLCFADRYPG